MAAIRINLLPWREIIRQKRKKDFFIYCALAAAAGAFVVFLGYLAIAEMISRQEADNALLTQEINKLNDQIGQVKELKSKLDNLSRQKGIVEALQKDRADTVELMKGILVIVPEKVFIREIMQEGKKITLQCTATDANGAIQMIENLSKSTFASNPRLLQTEAGKATITATSTLGAPDAQESGKLSEEVVIHSFSVVFDINLSKDQQVDPNQKADPNQKPDPNKKAELNQTTDPNQRTYAHHNPQDRRTGQLVVAAGRTVVDLHRSRNSR